MVVCVYVCVCVSVSVCVIVCMYVCMHVCVCNTHTHIHIYMFIHTHLYLLIHVPELLEHVQITCYMFSPDDSNCVVIPVVCGANFTGLVTKSVEINDRFEVSLSHCVDLLWTTFMWAGSLVIATVTTARVFTDDLHSPAQLGAAVEFDPVGSFDLMV